MSTEKYTYPIRVADDDKSPMVIENDKFTADELLKFKVRSLNLIKHNPNLFVNRGNGSFTEILGGNRALVTIATCGVAALLYRMRVNQIRKLSTKEGTWFMTVYLFYGMSLGATYSVAYFTNWQRLFNDYVATFLLQRYPASKEQKRSNIYQLKDLMNDDECYYFTSNYANSFHI